MENSDGSAFFSRSEAGGAKSITFFNTEEVDAFIRENATAYFYRQFGSGAGAEADAGANVDWTADTAALKRALAKVLCMAQIDGATITFKKKRMRLEDTDFRKNMFRGLVSHIGANAYIRSPVNIVWRSSEGSVNQVDFAMRLVASDDEAPRNISRHQAAILFICAYVYGLGDAILANAPCQA